MPTAPSRQDALRELGRWAKLRGVKPILFGIEPQDLPSLDGWSIYEIGRQPLFTASSDFCPELSGQTQPARGRELRRQARRALNKDVDWIEVSAGEVWELERGGHLDALFLARWQRQPLAEFSYLVSLRLASGQAVRRYFILGATHDRLPLGLVILVRSDRGWLLEHQLIVKGAPNGSGELFLCRALERFLAPGLILSLGITPLYRVLVDHLPHHGHRAILSFLPQPIRSRLVAAWEPLYGFKRLQRYRDKLDPHAWEPVYWSFYGSHPSLVLLAILRVFAGSSLLRFGLASLRKVTSKVALSLDSNTLWAMNAFYVATLALWIPVLWFLDGDHLFGASFAPRVWAVFDVLLLVGFVLHGKAIHSSKFRGQPSPRDEMHAGSSVPIHVSGWPYLLLGLVLADAVLSLIGTALFFCTRPFGWMATLWLVLLNLAPWTAVAFLAFCRLREPTVLRHER